jgi:hypothetical protein
LQEIANELRNEFRLHSCSPNLQQQEQEQEQEQPNGEVSDDIGEQIIDEDE